MVFFRILRESHCICSLHQGVNERLCWSLRQTVNIPPKITAHAGMESVEHFRRGLGPQACPFAELPVLLVVDIHTYCCIDFLKVTAGTMDSLGKQTNRTMAPITKTRGTTGTTKTVEA